MKRILFILLGLLCMIFYSPNLMCQDIIKTHKGNRLTVKVLEITPDYVKYKPYDNLSGPTYSINSKDVDLITFENGKIEYFEKQSKANILAYAPIKPNMKYKDYKNLYDPKAYIRDPYDPYNPVLTGILSGLIPGVGQFVNGQVGSGCAFLLSHLTASGLFGYYYSMSLYPNYAGHDTFVTVAGLLGVAVLAIDIWSICDAVRVSKIKDLYYRDCRALTSVEMNLSPYLASAQLSPNCIANVAGLKLSVKF